MRQKLKNLHNIWNTLSWTFSWPSINNSWLCHWDKTFLHWGQLDKTRMPLIFNTFIVWHVEKIAFLQSQWNHYYTAVLWPYIGARYRNEHYFFFTRWLCNPPLIFFQMPCSWVLLCIDYWFKRENWLIFDPLSNGFCEKNLPPKFFRIF